MIEELLSPADRIEEVLFSPPCCYPPPSSPNLDPPDMIRRSYWRCRRAFRYLWVGSLPAVFYTRAFLSPPSPLGFPVRRTHGRQSTNSTRRTPCVRRQDSFPLAPTCRSARPGTPARTGRRYGPGRRTFCIAVIGPAGALSPDFTGSPSPYRISNNMSVFRIAGLDLLEKGIA